MTTSHAWHGTPNRQRRVLARVALALVLLSVAACEALPPSTTAPTPPTPAPVTVTFACYEYEHSYYAALAEQFHAQQPEVRVEIVSLGDPRPAVSPTVELAALAGAADTFVASNLLLASSPEAPELQAMALDLSPWIAQDETVDTNDVYAAALAAMQREGGLWGLPLTFSLRVIFYNRALFAPPPTPTVAAAEPSPEATRPPAVTASPDDPSEGPETGEADLPDATPTADPRPARPRPGWSWAEFTALAAALTVRDGDAVRRWGYVDAMPAYTLPVLAYQRAGPLVEEADPDRLNIARPEVAAALQAYADLVRVHRVMPDPTTDVGGVGAEGYALAPAMWAGATFELDTFRQKYGDVGVAPFPEDGPAVTDLVVRGAVISAAAADPEAAWSWIVFLTHQPPGPYNDSVPARRSVATRARFWQRLDGEVAAAYAYALEHARPFPPPVYTALYRAYVAVLNGTPADAALAAAQAQAE